MTESDFVALEADTRKKPTLSLIKAEKKSERRYIDKKGNLHISSFDLVYLRLWKRLYVRGLKIANKNRELIIGENEFSFCIHKAEEYGKDVYFVDIPLEESVRNLVALPIHVKLAYLWLLYTCNGMPREANRNENYRENKILEGIIKREGHVDDLSRQGLLVVGITHAVNYYNSLSRRN